MNDTKENENYDIEDTVINDEEELKTSDIAKELDIAESTVRKYCNLLNKEGYQFRKDVTGARIYTSVDIDVIRDLLTLRKKAGIGVEQAAAVAATRNKRAIQATQDVQPLVNKENFDIEARYIKQELEGIREVISNTMTKNQGIEIINKLGEIATDYERMQKDYEVMKEKVDLANELLQKVAEKEPEKKGFFKRLFG